MQLIFLGVIFTVKVVAPKVYAALRNSILEFYNALDNYAIEVAPRVVLPFSHLRISDIYRKGCGT